jgi:predicted enzyme related to lactoylglutathione lyase
MPIVESHAPGSFCWIELATTDPNAAKQFYATLLGWGYADFPMQPDGIYTIFQLNGRDVGGGYTLNAEMLARHVPPHWMLYVGVASVDESAAKAQSLGATVMAGPFDVMDIGRMAVIQDPTGAVFSFWEAKTHKGMGIASEPGTLCWADLMTNDPAKAKPFYEQLFGWKIEVGQHGGDYLHIKNGESFIGGVPPVGSLPPNAPPHWQIYFLVKDCDASTAAAKSAGAQVYMEPMSMEGVGRWSVIADPQGAAFSLFQPPEHHE